MWEGNAEKGPGEMEKGAYNVVAEGSQVVVAVGSAAGVWWSEVGRDHAEDAS